MINDPLGRHSGVSTTIQPSLASYSIYTSSVTPKTESAQPIGALLFKVDG